VRGVRTAAEGGEVGGLFKGGLIYLLDEIWICLNNILRNLAKVMCRTPGFPQVLVCRQPLPRTTPVRNRFPARAAFFTIASQFAIPLINKTRLSGTNIAICRPQNLFMLLF
jgi:hypothetical protein